MTLNLLTNINFNKGFCKESNFVNTFIIDHPQ